jgi:hypothetical protein
MQRTRRFQISDLKFEIGETARTNSIAFILFDAPRTILGFGVVSLRKSRRDTLQ